MFLLPLLGGVKQMHFITLVRDAWRIPILRRKIVFTALILVVHRFAVQIPMPGINSETLSKYVESSRLIGALGFASNVSSALNQDLDLGLETIKWLSAGGFQNASVLALGVFPLCNCSKYLDMAYTIYPSP